MSIKRPFLRTPTKLIKSLVPVHVHQWIEAVAADRGVGLAAVAREILEQAYTSAQPPAKKIKSSTANKSRHDD